jgi:hypothetical protein
MSNIAAIRLNEMPIVLVTNFLAGTNTYITGKPAIGKSQMIEDYAAKMRERMPDFHLARFYAPTMSPMDIMASAPDNDKGTLKLYVNEALPNAYTHPDMKGAVFFGELPNTDPATMKLLQKYINGEDMSGVLRKPDGVVVIADGNRLEDKSGVQQQGRAFLSRMEQVEVFVPYDDCVAFAQKHTWHPNVQTFFKDNPALVDNYDEVFDTADARNKRSTEARQSNGSNLQAEEGKRGIWANMRSWERISKKEYAADSMNRKVTQNEIAGNVGTAVAAQYEAHRKILGTLTSFEDIIAAPDTAKIPDKMDEQYMLAMLVALRCKSDQLPQIRVFGTRMPLEMQALILRTMSMRKGFNLAATQDYLLWIKNSDLTKLLNGR